MTSDGVSIEWVGHACFRIISGHTTLVTDPYEPAELSLPPFALTADYVIASSLTDPAHSAVDLIEGSPRVVDALNESGDHLPFEFATAKKRESPLHPDGVRDNAMYAFRLGRLWIMHMGDTGEPLTDEDYDLFSDRCDVLLALAGGGLTVSLPDLDIAIDRLAPTWVIPMHYALPGMHIDLLPVTTFLERRDRNAILLVRDTRIKLDASLSPPSTPMIVVLTAAAISGNGQKYSDGVRFSEMPIVRL